MDWGRKAKVEREAAEWVVLIDSPDFNADAAARCRDWLSRSEDHRSAFLRAERAWTSLDRLEKLEAYPEILALLGADAKPNAGPAPAADRRALLLGAGVAGIAAIGVGATLGARPFGEHRSQIVSTGNGEQRDIDLADGTHIFLNARSRVEARIEPNRRTARLIEGEALFVIAPSNLGPFSIATPAGAIEIAAGEVVVKQLPDGVRIGLMSGSAVARAHALLGQGAPVAVGAQNELLFAHDALRVEAAPPARLARSTAWRQGMLAFDDTPLAEAVADVSRQTGKRFEFADPRLGERRIVGLIRASDLAAFLALLRTNLAIEASVHGDVIVLSPIPP